MLLIIKCSLVLFIIIIFLRKLVLCWLFLIALINDIDVLENDQLDQKKEKKDKNE